MITLDFYIFDSKFILKLETVLCLDWALDLIQQDIVLHILITPVSMRQILLYRPIH